MGDTAPPPTYQQPAPDPALAILQQQSQKQGIDALQETSRLDTARLMAIYGTRLAMAGSGSGSPLVMSPAQGGASNPFAGISPMSVVSGF